MKAILLLATVVATVTIASAAAAADKAACLDAADQGQKLRGNHQLIEARDKFRVCAAAGCPAVVQSDCASWLDAVEKDLPTVIPLAKNAAGTAIVDVSVSVDGQPLLSRLRGEAVPVDPGPHTFHFEAADGAAHDEQAVITEGGKNQMVVAIMGAAQPAGVGGQAPASGTPPAAAAAVESAPSSSSLRTWGWILGGAGAAGLAVGAVSGLVAMENKDAHCDANDVCGQGTTGAIKSAALVSDVGWIAGGLLTAGGIGLLLFAPGAGAGHTGGLHVAPVVASRGGGLGVSGSW